MSIDKDNTNTKTTKTPIIVYKEDIENIVDTVRSILHTDKKYTLTEIPSALLQVENKCLLDKGLLQDKTVIPTKENQTVLCDKGYKGLNKVKIQAINPNYVIPQGDLLITENGTISCFGYDRAIVKVKNNNDSDNTSSSNKNGILNVIKNGQYHTKNIGIVNVNIPNTTIKDIISGERTYDISDTNITKLNPYALAGYNQDSLKINLPNCTTLMEGCLSHSNIDTLTLGNIGTLPKNCFYDSVFTTDNVINNLIDLIEHCAYFYMDCLNEVNIGNTNMPLTLHDNQTFEPYALRGLQGLQKVIIDCKRIPYGLLENCTDLKYIYITKNVLDIQANNLNQLPFKNCNNLISIYVESDMDNIQFKNGYFNYINNTTIIPIKYNCNMSEFYNI